MFVLDHMEAGDEAWFPAESLRIGRHSVGVIQAITELGLAKGKIGIFGLEPSIPFQPEGIISHNFWMNLTANLPDVEFRPIATQFALLMMVQSEEEMAVLRHSALIGEAMVQAMVDTARPGVSEAEVYAASMAAALSRGTIIPWMHMCSGPDNVRFGPPAWGYRPTKPRVLLENDFITAEIFCNFGSRCTQHQASIAIGEAHEDTERAARVARACYEAGLKALRPKATFGEVAESMITPVEAVGGWVRGPQIHGINPPLHIARIPENHIHIDGVDAYPSMHGGPTLMPDFELAPGMTFVLEPSCGFGRHIVTIGGTVVVGQDGAIELNPSSGQLLRVGRKGSKTLRSVRPASLRLTTSNSRLI
jgi:Xaa-Pro aminopeptidase